MRSELKLNKNSMEFSQPTAASSNNEPQSQQHQSTIYTEENDMKKTMNTSPISLFRSICLLVLLTLSPLALADALQDAKQSGAVGEQRDGYLGAVTSSAGADIRALVARVNQERKARYEEIAKKNNLSLQQVQALAFEQAEQATLAGNYVQNASSAWAKK